MTHTFYQSLSNGDWLAWSSMFAGGLLLVVLCAAVASIERQEP